MFDPDLCRCTRPLGSNLPETSNPATTLSNEPKGQVLELSET